jgi:serralysin
MIDVVPDNSGSTVILPLSGTITGIIDTLGDHDWYRVSLVAGRTYTFETTPVSGGVTDTILTLRNFSGGSVAENDDASTTTLLSRIVFTPTTSGFYFLDIGAYNNQQIGGFSITSSVSIPSPNDFVAGSSSTTATLAIGGSANGVIDSNGDRDWYAVNLVAGQSYNFRTNPVGAGDVDTEIFLRNSAGIELAANDDFSGAYSGFRFTPTTSGTYYIDVGAYNNSGTGTFNVSADIAPPLSVFTNDQIATQLTNGYWGAGREHRFNVTTGGNLTYNVTALNADGQFLARQAFSLWSDVTGIAFNEVATGGSIVVGHDSEGADANATFSGGITTAAVVNIATTWITTYGNTLNSYSFQTFVHEIGHALGLGHGGNYNGNAIYNNDALYLNDSWVTTVMSYFDPTQNTYFANQGFTLQFAVGPMLADILAVQQLYGVSTTTRTGDTTYGFGSNSGRDIFNADLNPNVSYTVYDNGGTDTLDYSQYADNQRIDLNSETFSNIGGRVGNVTIARGVVIENARGGAGNDTIIGNSVGNQLFGFAGNDNISGGLGNDLLYGFGDSDTLNGENGNDTLFGGDGIDTVNGGTGEDVIYGGSGADTLAGGADRDEYYDVDSGDVINELAGGGYDVVFAIENIILALDSEVEQISIGAAVTNVLGSNTANYIIGNALANGINGRGGGDILSGFAGTDTLDGAEGDDLILGGDDSDFIYGGAGVDSLYGDGGADYLEGNDGNDFFYLVDSGDTVVELAGGGYDVVYAIENAVLGVAADIELIVFIGAVTAITGSSAANYIVGNGGASTFSGLGGDDTFIAGGGDDLVLGGDGADSLYGDDGNDVLDGGAGVDYLSGGAGADIFRVSDAGSFDLLVDFQSGTDQIALSNAAFSHTASLNFIAGAGAQVATNGDSTFLYDSSNGRVYYDADGTGAGEAVFILAVSQGTVFSASDFVFY